MERLREHSLLPESMHLSDDDSPERIRVRIRSGQCPERLVLPSSGYVQPLWEFVFPIFRPTIIIANTG